jgi:hypothetical protein
MSLKATPDRGILITTSWKDGKCAGFEALATINKVSPRCSSRSLSSTSPAS